MEYCTPGLVGTGRLARKTPCIIGGGGVTERGRLNKKWTRVKYSEELFSIQHLHPFEFKIFLNHIHRLGIKRDQHTDGYLMHIFLITLFI